MHDGHGPVLSQNDMGDCERLPIWSWIRKVGPYDLDTSPGSAEHEVGIDRASEANTAHNAPKDHSSGDPEHRHCRHWQNSVERDIKLSPLPLISHWELRHSVTRIPEYHLRLCGSCVLKGPWQSRQEGYQSDIQRVDYSTDLTQVQPQIQRVRRCFDIKETLPTRCTDTSWKLESSWAARCWVVSDTLNREHPESKAWKPGRPHPNQKLSGHSIDLCSSWSGCSLVELISRRSK